MKTWREYPLSFAFTGELNTTVEVLYDGSHGEKVCLNHVEKFRLVCNESKRVLYETPAEFDYQTDPDFDEEFGPPSNEADRKVSSMMEHCRRAVMEIVTIRDMRKAAG